MATIEWQDTRAGDKRRAKIRGLSALVMADKVTAGAFGFQLYGVGGELVERGFGFASWGDAMRAAANAAGETDARISYTPSERPDGNDQPPKRADGAATSPSAGGTGIPYTAPKLPSANLEGEYRRGYAAGYRDAVKNIGKLALDQLAG